MFRTSAYASANFVVRAAPEVPPTLKTVVMASNVRGRFALRGVSKSSPQWLFGIVRSVHLSQMVG
jgi:hypothetical protein